MTNPEPSKGKWSEQQQLAIFLAIVAIAWLTFSHFFTLTFPAGHMP